jgi:hypothetical protein
MSKNLRRSGLLLNGALLIMTGNPALGEAAVHAQDKAVLEGPSG